MLKVRVIPIVLWNDSHCVQTVRFGRPARVFGSLMDAVRVYERRNVDELIMLDISGNPFAPPLQYAQEMFCPVTVGGGIRSLEHIEQALRWGADKVAIRTAATPQFVEVAAKKFGSQAIVLSLDAFKIAMNFDDGIIDRCMATAQDAESAGAGEILLTSVEHNGTMSGYDLDLIRAVSEAVTIPVIAHGGCGKPEHMLEAIKAGAHTVAASTLFLFTETTPRDCSRYLVDRGVEARIS